MAKTMIRIHDTSTDEVIDREMTDEEFAAHEANKKAQAEIAAAKVKAEADKSGLLKRLGLTEDELQTILG